MIRLAEIYQAEKQFSQAIEQYENALVIYDEQQATEPSHDSPN